MSQIYFYLPRRESIATPLLEFVKRWEIYATAVREIENDAVITLLLDEEYLDSSLQGLKVLKLSRNRMIQVLTMFSFFSKGNQDATLISGNNFDALAVALFVRRFRPKLKVQASIHAEIDAIYAQVGLKASIKRMILKFLFPKLDSLRVVREQEVEKASKVFGFSADKIVVCPVPIELPKISSGAAGKSVGYLGRIHEERSPLVWSEIALRVSFECPSSSFLIAGSGPEEFQMRKVLSSISSRVRFLGHVRGDEIEEFWQSTKTLLITAPFESYGLAAREALLRGVVVVAPNIAVYRELKVTAPTILFLFDNIEEAILLVRKSFHTSVSQSELTNFRESFVESQKNHLMKLARSWL